MPANPEVLVVGAGILGLSAAHFLAERGLRVTVLERGDPLACTSDKSTECYRVFWPGNEALAALVGRSLDLLQGFAAVARPNRRGYLYVGEEESLLLMAQEAPHAGPLRVHKRALSYPKEAAWGLDLVRPGALGEVFPYLGHLRGRAALHVRPAGWFSAQGLGMGLLEALRQRGGRLIHGEFLELEREGGAAPVRPGPPGRRGGALALFPSGPGSWSRASWAPCGHGPGASRGGRAPLQGLVP